MTDDVTFIMRRSFLDKIEKLPQETYLKVIAEICHYGCEKEPLFPDDIMIQTMINMYKDNIDFSKERYAAKINGGRPKKVTDEMIIQGFNEGKSAAEMGRAFGCDPSTITKRAIWKELRARGSADTERDNGKSQESFSQEFPQNFRF